jgi:hypothetical protein
MIERPGEFFSSDPLDRGSLSDYTPLHDAHGFAAHRMPR